eukprot:scaffold297489_cov28-Prasinocladus_malaysianus.AAC.2
MTLASRSCHFRRVDPRRRMMQSFIWLHSRYKCDQIICYDLAVRARRDLSDEGRCCWRDAIMLSPDRGSLPSEYPGPTDASALLDNS